MPGTALAGVPAHAGAASHANPSAGKLLKAVSVLSVAWSVVSRLGSGRRKDEK